MLSDATLKVLEQLNLKEGDYIRILNEGGRIGTGSILGQTFKINSISEYTNSGWHDINAWLEGTNCGFRVYGTHDSFPTDYTKYWEKVQQGSIDNYKIF